MLKFDIKLTEKITIGISISFVGLVFYLLKDIQSVYYFFYQVYLILEKNILSFYLSGIIFFLIFIIIKIALSDKMRKLKSPLLVVTLSFGIISFCCAILAPLLNPYRYSDPSIHLIQNKGILQVNYIRDYLDNIGIDFQKTIGFSETRNVKSSESLKSALRKIKYKNHDIVILDYYNPLEFIDFDTETLLNPTTLYILTQPLNEETLPKSDNIVLLSPNLSDEIVSIVSSIPDSINTIQLYRSSDIIGKKAESLFLKLLPNSLNRVISRNYTKDIQKNPFHESAYIVWLDWYNTPSELINDKKLKNTDRIITGSNVNVLLPNLKYQNHFVFFDEKLENYNTTLHANQMAAIKTIINSHFEENRPLNLNITLARTKEEMRNNKYGFFTSKNNLIYKYTGLKIIKYD